MAKSFSRYVIRSTIPDASGAFPYWNGEFKCWVPGMAFASIYKHSYREKIEREGRKPESGEWQMIGRTEQAFTDRFKTKMMEAIRTDPSGFNFGLDEVDEKVREIVANLKAGNAEPWPIARKVASEFGIPGKGDAIRVFLNTPPAA